MRQRPSWRPLIRATAGAALTALALSGCVTTAPAPGSTAPMLSPVVDSLPKTQTDVLARDLTAPSDIQVTSDGVALLAMGEQVITIAPDGTSGTIANDLAASASDTVLLDVAFRSRFPSDPALFVCARTRSELRVVRLNVSADLQSASTEDAALLSRIPGASGDQATCEMAFGPDGYLYVGTTDAADPKAPQDLASLGGKILRLDAQTGEPAPDNPFINRPDANAKLVYSYGHRSIQALAWHPTTGALYAVDRGPGHDDEVDLIVPGGNYGWNPAARSATSYDATGAPMTDLSLSNVKPATWSSGATNSGLTSATFIKGSEWGAVAGHLAVAGAPDSRVIFLPITGEIVGPSATIEAVNMIGPSYAVTQDGDGALYMATATGSKDRLVRVRVVG